MDIRRVILISALFFLGYSFNELWQKEHPHSVPSLSAALVNESKEQPFDLFEKPETVQQKSETFKVETDVLSLGISRDKGNIVDAQLLKYPVSVGKKNTPFPLLFDEAHEEFISSMEFMTYSDATLTPLSVNYTYSQNDIDLNKNKKELKIILKGSTQEGLMIEKIFKLKKGSYLIDVDYHLINPTATPWIGYLNLQLSRTAPKEASSFAALQQVGSYTGGSYSNPNGPHYQKISFKEMKKNKLNETVEGGWIAMQQRYFLSSWIFDKNTSSRFYTRTSANELYTMGAISPSITLQPHQEKTLHSQLYLGPEVASQLKEAAPYLDLTIDYGFLWFLSTFLFTLMKTIYHYVGNWGWSIIMVTVLIRLLFYRLSATSYRSMAAMRKLQPKLQVLKERYGEDKAKLSQATMELYRSEKVNPLSGCLPILVQIPVMMALYWVLAESVEFRLAPFIFWIQDLSSADPFHVLPILMGMTMLIQQRLNPAPPDPVQAKVMMFLPVFFTFLFWNLPSGLVLYWTVGNALTILQQWYITRTYQDEPRRKIKK